MGPRGLLVVYSLLIEAVVWFALVPALWVRSLGHRAGDAERSQRLARAPRASPPRSPATRPVLLHAVSVGEMNAAAPLVAELGAHGCRVLLTTGTHAGLLTAERIAREHATVDACVYLPWDRRAVRGWLRATEPAAVVVMETEIWPNLFAACEALKIPLFIANGKIRSADVRKYQFARAFFGRVLDSATWIGVQTVRECDRFAAIGAPVGRVEVAGNLKFDAALRELPPPEPLEPDPAGRPLVVAGSTHDPEERWLLECVRSLAADGRAVRLVLAPRDVTRAAGIARRAQAFGVRSLLWSERPANPSAPWDVLVLDQYATLRSCYASADLVVIGGTFVPVGGHNILEAAAVARPILVGPYVDGISALVDSFAAAGALMSLPGRDPVRELSDACRQLLDDPERARAMGAKAGEICRQGSGSAAHHARAILGHIYSTPRSRK